MKDKLERGEYRSAQAMQKDFLLVTTNCLQFNAPDSDIVREAQRQTLMRPKLLKEAALKNNMFICDEWVFVLEVVFIRSSQLMMLDSSNFTLLYIWIFQINLSSGNVIHLHDPSPKKTEGKLVACGNCEDSNGVAGEQTNNGKNV